MPLRLRASVRCEVFAASADSRADQPLSSVEQLPLCCLALRVARLLGPRVVAEGLLTGHGRRGQAAEKRVWACTGAAAGVCYVEGGVEVVLCARMAVAALARTAVLWRVARPSPHRQLIPRLFLPVRPCQAPAHATMQLGQRVRPFRGAAARSRRASELLPVLALIRQPVACWGCWQAAGCTASRPIPNARRCQRPRRRGCDARPQAAHRDHRHWHLQRARQRPGRLLQQVRGAAGATGLRRTPHCCAPATQNHSFHGR